MPGHELWHAGVLAITLFGVAALAIVLLTPLAFDAPPAGFVRLRPLLFGVAALAGALLVFEWLFVH